MSNRNDQVRTIARWTLGAALLVAGSGHLTVQREEFQAQVPSWFPADEDAVVLVSGVVELLLGAALILSGRKRAPAVGLVVAGFFIVIFPGNIAQFAEHKDAFGLDTDGKRFVRLLFQPLLVLWALWSTGGWRWLRARLDRTRSSD
ncbi:DoxX family protein [Dermatobacter hominis]|uniref:DoxX family protein n=1 Tax=Dermatobacter hominis TaxID=2884263 RepID=UPI001D0F8093|nr:hypothetical protein [Dermatobacter hominis]UDY34505.1 hypothetical protein LH044_14305 [Dermatobacter hominis]